MVAKGLAAKAFALALLRRRLLGRLLRRELRRARHGFDRRDTPARRFDRGLRALGCGDAGDLEHLVDLAREDDLGALRVARDESRLLQAVEIDRLARHA